MRLAGAALSRRGRDVLEHDRERIKAPGLPLGADVSGLLGREQMPLGRHTNGGWRLEEALELAHGRGLLEEEQRARSRSRGHELYCMELGDGLGDGPAMRALRTNGEHSNAKHRSSTGAVEPGRGAEPL